MTRPVPRRRYRQAVCLRCNGVGCGRCDGGAIDVRVDEDDENDDENDEEKRP